MSQLWSTGPAYFYAAPSPGVYTTGGAPLFIGTVETKPIIDVDDEWTPVRNDIGGSVPIDKLFDGQSGMVTCDFNRFNYGVMQALCTVPNTAAALGFGRLPPNAFAPGFNQAGDVGTLAVTEGQVFALIIVFPYWQKPAYGGGGGPAAGGMVPGYRFWGAETNKESIHGGTDAHRKRLIFDCQRVPYTGGVAGAPAPNNLYGTVGFALYDNAITAWGTLPNPT
jgi:hypothetical protein